MESLCWLMVWVYEGYIYLCRNFNGNNLACDCNVYSSLVAVINALSQGSAAVCVSPPRVASVEFFPGGSYEDQPVQDFTCCMYSQPTRDTLSALISSSEFNDVVKRGDPLLIGHVRYINILTWLRGFQDKLLYLVLFSLYSSLFWELRDKRNLKKFAFLTRKPCSHVRILIYRTWRIT